MGEQQNLPVTDLVTENGANICMKGKDVVVRENFLEEISGSNFPAKKRGA
jgi:hypothetical protein